MRSAGRGHDPVVGSPHPRSYGEIITASPRVMITGGGMEMAEIEQALRAVGLEPDRSAPGPAVRADDPASQCGVFLHCATAGILGWRAELSESLRRARWAPLAVAIDHARPEDLLCALEMGVHAALPREVGAAVLAMQVRRLLETWCVRGAHTESARWFTDAERQLIKVLSDPPGRMVSHEELLRAAKILDDGDHARSLLRVRMSRIRRKLGPAGKVLLRSARNNGYVLHQVPQAESGSLISWSEKHPASSD